MRGDRDRLLDMIEMCDLLTEHASDPAVLRRNPVVQAAAQRWIEVLGEAASRISDELRQQHAEVPWREIIGTRTILAHAYFHVDQDVVGGIVVSHVPQLRRQIAAILDLLDET